METVRLARLSNAVLLAVLLGCGAGERSAERAIELPVQVFSDTGRTLRFPVDTAMARGIGTTPRVWLASVTPFRPEALETPMPEPGSPEDVEGAPPALQVDDDLKPPIPRGPAPLHPPGRARGFVDLDVRVDEAGEVSDALWAGGADDSALVAAAVECALAMRFYPALQGGRPIAVWCRQRVDFGSDRARR